MTRSQSRRDRRAAAAAIREQQRRDERRRMLTVDRIRARLLDGGFYDSRETAGRVVVITSEAAPGTFSAFGSAFPQAAVPTTPVGDRQGRLAARVLGPVTYPTLQGLVHDTAGEPGDPR